MKIFRFIFFVPKYTKCYKIIGLRQYVVLISQITLSLLTTVNIKRQSVLCTGNDELDNLCLFSNY